MIDLHLRFIVFPSLAGLCWSMALPSESEFKLPETMKEYFKQRDTLLEDEKTFENRKWTLSEDEMYANQFFQYLKWRDVNNSTLSGFSTSRQIQDVLPEIRHSELYKLLIDLPKGGNLHSHENQQLSKKILLDIIWSSNDFDNLYINKPINDTFPKDPWLFNFFINPPKDQNWVKVSQSGLSKEELLKTTNYVAASTPDIGRLNTDSSARWQFFNQMVARAGSSVINNIGVKREYIKALYNSSLNEGITYLETRRSYSASSLYELDPSGNSNATNGRKNLNANLTFEIDMILGIQREFIAQNPKFLGHKVIVTATRSSSQGAFQTALDNAIKLNQKYPYHVIGFDNVGEEDNGFSTLNFMKNYLKDFYKGRAAIPLYLHSVETNWPDDLMANTKDDDLVPTLQNAYETILLQPRRIGHGKGFTKFPYLRHLMKERRIAIETCLISNQILGYDPDLRNHFGQYFHKEGIPVVLAPDDPGSLGYDGVTVDWYAAFISWGLNVGDLKQLALNSLKYSAMNASEIENAVNKWSVSWNEFMSKMRNLACSRDYAGEANSESRRVMFTQTLPQSGPPGTMIHIFGRNFEIAICKTTRCKFGEKIVEAVYISNRHLMCEVPQCQGCLNSVDMSVALDGEHFENLNYSFTYDTSPELSDSRSYVPDTSIVFYILFAVFNVINEF